MSHFVSSAATRDVNIRTWAAQLLDNATIKTPQEVFREQYLAVQDMVDGEIGLLKGLDQTSDHTASRDRLGKYFGQLRQLEEGHKATVQDKEQTYDREMEERHKQQFVDYIGHLGLSLAGPWMKEIMDAAAAAGEDTPVIHRSGPLSDDSVAPSEAAKEAIPDAFQNSHPTAGRKDELKNAVESNHHDPQPDQRQPDQPRQDQPRQDQPRQDQPRQDQPRQDQPRPDKPQPDQPQPDQPQLDQLQTDQLQPYTQPPSDLEPRPKTQLISHHHPHTETRPSPAKRPVSPLPRPEKRPRLDNAPPPPPPPPPNTQRSIDFEQVFQDGHAKIKYQIARFPPKHGPWYILECKQHDQHFIKQPIIGAAKHMRAPAHGSLHGTHFQAVQMFGTRVRNCSEELAKMNNDAAQEAFKIGLGMPSPKRHPRKAHPDGSTRSTTRSSRSGPVITDPRLGEIYAAYWKDEKKFYAVLTLPQEPFPALGLQAPLREKGLLGPNKPSCFVTDENELSVCWAQGYEDGGPLVTKRKFPVMFFDQDKFPTECGVGWVSVHDLKEYDQNDKTIPHRDLVAQFMQNQPAEGLRFASFGTSLRNPEGGVEGSSTNQQLQPAVHQGPSVKEEPGAPIPEQGHKRFPQSPIVLSSDDESDFDEEVDPHQDSLNGQVVDQGTQMQPNERIAQDNGKNNTNEAEDNGGNRVQPQEDARNGGEEEINGLPPTTDLDENGMLLDYKALWRLSSSDIEQELEDLMGAIRQDGGRVNTSTSEHRAAEAGDPTLGTASGPDAPNQQNPKGTLVVPEDDTDIKPVLTAPHPAPQQCLSKDQPSPGSAFLMAQQRYQKIVAARATVSTALAKDSSDERPLPQATSASGYPEAAPSAQPAGPQPQPERCSGLGSTAPTDSTTHQPRKVSFLDAVLGPREESGQLNGGPQRQMRQDNSNARPPPQASNQMYSWVSAQTQGQAGR